MIAAEIVKALGGRGNKARCPVHKGGRERTPSLSVSDGADGKLLVNCKAGCSQADVWAALTRRGLVGNGTGPDRSGTPARPEKTPAERIAEASAIWQPSGPAIYSPGAGYLRCRGITAALPDCLRYHERDHALVALLQDANGDFSGVQRIFLATDARGTWKRSRISNGIHKGAACRLTPAGATLQLCESIEDGLALAQMTSRPTWATCGAGFLESFRPPPEVREIVLAPDNDKAGTDAIASAAAKLPSLVEVKQMLPPQGMDWCDVLESYEERVAIQEEPEIPPTWAEDFVNG